MMKRRTNVQSDRCRYIELGPNSRSIYIDGAICTPECCKLNTIPREVLEIRIYLVRLPPGEKNNLKNLISNSYYSKENKIPMRWNGDITIGDMFNRV